MYDSNTRHADWTKRASDLREYSSGGRALSRCARMEPGTVGTSRLTEGLASVAQAGKRLGMSVMEVVRRHSLPRELHRQVSAAVHLVTRRPVVGNDGLADRERAADVVLFRATV